MIWETKGEIIVINICSLRGRDPSAETQCRRFCTVGSEVSVAEVSEVSLAARAMVSKERAVRLCKGWKTCI